MDTFLCGNFGFVISYMVVKVKQYFEKTKHVKKTINLKNIIYEDKEIQDIMKNYYLIKRNLISFLKRIISFSFV